LFEACVAVRHGYIEIESTFLPKKPLHSLRAGRSYHFFVTTNFLNGTYLLDHKGAFIHRISIFPGDSKVFQTDPF